MAKRFPPPSDSLTTQLVNLGQRIRQQRKALGVSVNALAESADISRITLYRIEKGEPSVTMGSWISVLAAIGLSLQTSAQYRDEPEPHPSPGWIPTKIKVGDYPQLKALAWHVQGEQTLTPKEALDIYERNERHLNPESLTEDERNLLSGLKDAVGSGNHRV
jgi:transcriptional regulator with XRE-family HTH domain